jgi:nucleotide-binding universal stress UspA family protein
MKKILVPFVFSDQALNALKVAAGIARKAKAEIILVHNYSLSTADFYNVYFFENLNREKIIKINKKLDSILSLDFLKNIKISRQLFLNVKLWKTVTDRSFLDVDLIVMGKYCNREADDFFISSNTEKIIRLANAPVLTVKNKIEDFNIKKVVFASNFDGESYTVFKKIKYFANLYEARIDRLKIITPRDSEATPVSLKLMEDFATKFQLTNYSVNIVNATSIKKGISDFSDKVSADLIAVQTQGKTGLFHLINGSLAEEVAKHEGRPVLSVRTVGVPANASGLSGYLEQIKITRAQGKVKA